MARKWLRCLRCRHKYVSIYDFAYNMYIAQLPGYGNSVNNRELPLRPHSSRYWC